MPELNAGESDAEVTESEARVASEDPDATDALIGSARVETSWLKEELVAMPSMFTAVIEKM